MRIGIIANSLSLALKTYRELKDLSDCELFVLLSANPERSNAYSLFANLARVALAPPRWVSLFLLLRRNRLRVFTGRLDDPHSVRRISGLKLDVGLHQSGIIYRDPTIAAFRLGILNPHIGLLPKYRGRNVMEWSLFNGDPTGVTVFFVDSGIDTGSRIVVSEKVDVSNCKSLAEAKQSLFSVQGAFFRKALERLRSEVPEYQLNDNSGRRHFVMSRLFQNVTTELLQGKN